MTSSQPQSFRRVGFVGFGLMGGSLARDLKALPDPPTIRACSAEPKDLEEGRTALALDEAVRDGRIQRGDLMAQGNAVPVEQLTLDS